MAKHRKSLLDAFRAVPPTKGDVMRRPTPEPVRAAPRRTEARAEAAIPVRAAVAEAPAPRRPGTHADVAPPRPPLSRERIAVLALLGLLIVVALVLVLQRTRTPDVSAAGTPGREVQNQSPKNSLVPRGNGATAADTRGGASDASRVAAKPALDPGVGTTDDDRAFLDPRNRFTVRLVDYTDDAAGEKMARDAYRYLRGEGVTVVQPVRRDGRLYLCAGAEPKMDALAGQHAYIKKLRGPGGRQSPFETAYIDNIDHVLKR